MSEDPNSPGSTTWVPDACTLPTVERPLRLAEFDELFAATVESERVNERRLRLVLADRIGLAGRVGLAGSGLAGAGGLAHWARDLAARESECCSFFAFTVTSRPPDRVVVDIEVPIGHVDVLDALAQRSR